MFLPREETEDILRRLNAKEALALIGPRRAGKSTLAHHVADIWKETRGKSLFLDLERPGLVPTLSDLDNSTTGLKPGDLLVLDEVQNVDGWEKWARNVVENELFKLIISGSNSRLLSSEVATSLAGRALPKKILTLSFRDFKKWGGKNLTDYLRLGGYPECVKRPDDLKELIETYFELAILRDVAARYNIREISALRSFATIALSESGKTLNIPRTALKIGVSAPTVRQFLQALEEAFLVLAIPSFNHSPREREASLKKLYSYDLGMRSVLSVSESPDVGRIWENCVAIELIRRGYRLSYLPGENECDFLAEKPGEALAVQVCSDETIPEREIAGLLRGMKARQNSKGIIINPNLDEKRKTSLGEILFVPLEKWLLH
ncbi:MAG: ATP-binding protein [Candidatus Micrarchaeia archaeon]|jgi:hypothetical protein